MSHCPLGEGPWHQHVDVRVEMAVGAPDDEIAQNGIGFDAVHFASGDQAARAPLRPPSSCPAKTEVQRFMAGLRIAFATKLGPMSTRPLSSQRRKRSSRRNRCAMASARSDLRDTRGLSCQPRESQPRPKCRARGGIALAAGSARSRVRPSKVVRALAERCNTHKRLVHDGRTFLGLAPFASPMCPAERQPCALKRQGEDSRRKHHLGSCR